jgi:chemotaxis protein MotB
VEGQNIIIIKKVKKGAQGGSHGGSWKVAYADFVTAMMAFFLLLWLITMVAPEKRARVANYFKHFSILEKSGITMLENNRSPIAGLLIGEDGNQKSGERAEPSDDTEDNEVVTPEKYLKKEIERQVEQELGDGKDQVMVEAFDGGVRIELMDSDGASMFAKGRSELTPEGKKLIKIISGNLVSRGSKIALEGHTDAHIYLAKNLSNWELSTERASAARKELERNGLPPDRLIRVAGFAATDPLVEGDPYDPRNRRISILVFDQQHPIVIVPEDPKEQLNPNLIPVGKFVQAEPQNPLSTPIDPVQQYLFNK